MKVPSVITVDTRSDSDQAEEYRDQGHENADPIVHALPPKGRTYILHLPDPTQGLGVLFFRASQLTSTLLTSPQDRNLALHLGDRPVASHCFQGSAGERAGIRPGHVLVRVGDAAVDSPEAVVRAVRSADPRAALSCEVYVPDWAEEVNVFEREAVVDLDAGMGTASGGGTEAYVVVGGILQRREGDLQIYKSKADYDQTIFDSKDELAVSVKKNAFALQGAQAHVHSSDTSSYISLKLQSSSGKVPVIKITTPGRTLLEDLLERICYNVARYQEVPVHSTESKSMTKKFLNVCKRSMSTAQ